MSETFAGFGGAALALHRVGEGRPLILLHGLFSDATMNWIKFGHAETIAAQGYEVLMPDLRAHGASAAPHDAAAYPPDVLVRDLIALVDHLGMAELDPVHRGVGEQAVKQDQRSALTNPMQGERGIAVAGKILAHSGTSSPAVW